MKTFQSNDLLLEKVNPVLKMAAANDYGSLTYSICRWKSFLLGLGGREWIIPAVTPNVRFYQARVTIPGDHGIIHFLVREEEGRSIDQSSVDVMRAGFLALRFDSPLYEFVNRAELKEITEADFTLRKFGQQLTRHEREQIDAVS